MEELVYYPKGTCSKTMKIKHEDGKIVSLEIIGGCHGNLQGISALVRGMPIEEVISRLEGIKCGFKSTSCPDQFAQALKSIK